MPQKQVKEFAGFGVIYPDGVTGIRVVNTYTEAPKKHYNPDGTLEYIQPPPAIHELAGGAGFVYANGLPVTEREHLENITAKGMRERALKWFDESRVVNYPESPEIREVKKEEPEPVFVASPQFKEGGLTEDGITEARKKGTISHEPVRATEETVVSSEELKERAVADIRDKSVHDKLDKLIDVVGGLATRVKTLEDAPEVKKMKKGHQKMAQREAMLKKWQDPEYVKKTMEARMKGKQRVESER